MERWYVEGLVKAEDLGDGFVLDKDGHALVEKRSGRSFRVGDDVEVEVAAVDPARRRIDLSLVEGGKTRAPGAVPRAKGHGRGGEKEGKRSRSGGKGPGKSGRAGDGRKRRRR
jgi:ribonuclease R